MRKHTASPEVAISTPAMVGPSMRPPFCISALKAMALARSSRAGTIAGREGLAHRHVDRHDHAEEGRHDDDVPDLDRVRAGERGEREPRHHGRGLRRRAAASCGRSGRPTGRRRARARGSRSGSRSRSRRAARPSRSGGRPASSWRGTGSSCRGRPATGRRRTAGSCGGGTRAANESSQEFAGLRSAEFLTGSISDTRLDMIDIGPLDFR